MNVQLFRSARLLILFVTVLLSGGALRAQPTNDFFVDRVILVGTNVSVAGDNTGSSTEPGEDVGSGFSEVTNTVWYAWTPPANGSLTFSATQNPPIFPLKLSLYRGESLGALTEIFYAPLSPLSVTEGETIVFRVAAMNFSGAPKNGPFTLSLSLGAAPPTSTNDAFADRVEITAPYFRFEGGIRGATNEQDEPLPDANARQTLWWSFEAPADGLFRFVTTGYQFQPRLAIYEGTALTTLVLQTPVSPLHYRVEQGHRYAVQMSSGWTPVGAFTLEARFQTLSNDFFAGSERLEGTNFSYHGSYTLGTPESGEPASGATNTVWASWQATFAGPVRYKLEGTSNRLGIFTGTTLENLQTVVAAGPVGVGTSTFIAQEGETYHFQFSGEGNDFILILQAERFPPPAADQFADAQFFEGQPFQTAPASITGATMENGDPRPLGTVGQKSVWWKWQAPRYGILNLTISSATIPQVHVAVYQGDSVSRLGLIAAGTNGVQFFPIAGEVYYFGAVVPEDAVGDVVCIGRQSGMSASSAILPGNILREPSWEDTAITQANYWKRSGGGGGYVNESGGAHGRTWPVVALGGRIWQDFPTVPGHTYAIQFAHRVGGDLSRCCGIAGVKVLWNEGEISTHFIPEYEGGFWHWEVVTATATSSTSRVTFENLHRTLEMDAFSVIDLTAPPEIITQPTSLSTVVGGSAAFFVSAIGAPELAYQWYFNGQALAGETRRILFISPVSSGSVGSYYAVVTNTLGQAISSPAVIEAESPTNVTILVQPYGDTVPAGSYVNLGVIAAGLPPMEYQWLKNGQPLAARTNRNLVLSSAQLGDTGLYEVLVRNSSSSAVSLPASLTVTTNLPGGGRIDFRNEYLAGPVTNRAPVFNIDGTTPLTNNTYLAQLYAGPDNQTLRPVGDPRPFLTGTRAGLFQGQTVTLAGIAPGAAVSAQVRAWEAARGTSYEEARVLGGRFGRSKILNLTAGGGTQPPAVLAGLESFNLQTGLPQFNVGVIELLEKTAKGVLVWRVRGAPGFRYLVERSVRSEIPAWRPHVVLTNATGVVTFTDPGQSEAQSVFYRTRIVD